MFAIFSLRTGHPVIDSYAIEVEMGGGVLRRTRWVLRDTARTQQSTSDKLREDTAVSRAEKGICSSAKPPSPIFSPFAAALKDWETGEANPWKNLVDLLDPSGTDFQAAIREALWQTRRSEIISYTSLAHRANAPKAVRAAATACANNPVVLVAACHRVVPAPAAATFAALRDTVLQEVKDLGPAAAPLAAKHRHRIPQATLRFAAPRLQPIDLGKYAFGGALKRALVEFELAWEISAAAECAARN